MHSKGSLTVVGLGPGDASLLAPEALRVLLEADVIAGYTAYIDLLDPALLEGRAVISNGMMGEMARCEAAIEAAAAGKQVALVCSGDPGVYALAGLVLEMLEQRQSGARFHVVPGIPAVCAAAALLGAPLMHDFACISLSDLLTPWATIEKRLHAAFSADFVTVLYNPRSKRRADYLETAARIAGAYRAASTPVGVARAVFRPDQTITVTTLKNLKPEDADMFTLLIIGNSQSRIVPGRGDKPLEWEHGARMLTPRGYMEKYGLGREKSSKAES